jgi:hypothetical protein
MLCQYCALIHSKIKYGSFVYGLISQTKLSIIDPVHNIGICLATGAFCTSRLESIYAKAGEPPLSFRWNLLLWNYAAKLNSQPSHPSFAAMFKPSLHHWYETNRTASWPVGVCLQQLLVSLNVNLPHTVPYRYTPTLPWLLTLPISDLHLTRHGKSSTLCLQYQLLYRDAVRVPWLHSFIYTDRSLIQNSPGCAFLYDDNVLNSDYTAWLV